MFFFERKCLDFYDEVLSNKKKSFYFNDILELETGFIAKIASSFLYKKLKWGS